MKTKPHRTEYLFPDVKPHVPARTVRRIPLDNVNTHPLPTLAAQSEREKRLHSDPEYCRLIRECVGGVRQWRASWSYDRSPDQKDFNNHVPDNKRLPKQPKVFHPKTLNARALVEQEGWKPGSWLQSRKWCSPRQLLEVSDHGVWISESKARDSRSRCGKRHLVETLPVDTVVLTVDAEVAGVS